MPVENCLRCGKPIIRAVVDGKPVYLDSMKIVSFKLHQRPEAKFTSATMHVTHPEHLVSGLCKPQETISEESVDSSGQTPEDYATVVVQDSGTESVGKE